MKLFLFAIGGTGARVLRSLTMLLASGIKTDCEMIVPIIIDLDIQNGDTNRTIKALEIYKKVRDKAYTQTPQEGFFHTNLVTLSQIKGSGDQRVKDSFQLDFGNINTTFSEFLRVPQMDLENQNLLNLLFDNSPRGSHSSELNLDLNVGFKGNPNIGSIIFNDIVNTEEYKYFETSFQDGDRIFIISSIFGGTGASGFPQLIKNIRKSRNNYIRDAKIGAAVVMPYFSVEDDKSSAIDSRNFVSKTKAALSYYAHSLDRLDAMYYMYDKPSKTYQNIQGGTEQKNSAHLVELITAMSIVKFANKNDFKFNQTDYHEFGVKEGADILDFRHFFEDTRQQFFVPLVFLSFFAKLYVEHIPQNMDTSFAKDLGLVNSFSREPFFNDIREFLNVHFANWLRELSENNKGFAPFKFSDGFNTFIKGKVVDTGFLDKGLSKDFFNKALIRFENDLSKSNPSKEERFMKVLYLTCKKAFEEKIQALPA